MSNSKLTYRDHPASRETIGLALGLATITTFLGQSTFLAGAAFTTIAVIGVVSFRGRLRAKDHL